MSKLWAKGYELISLIENFTVGDDYILDNRLIPSDIMGSLAHAIMLHSIDMLKQEELASLRNGLLTILKEHRDGNFSIQLSDEDGHTAIENRLIEMTGEAGKRIHLGRSRNDQSLTMLRIWMRHALFQITESGTDVVETMLQFARKNMDVPMPGRTHMQPAMPSSVGLWAAGFAEQLLDDLQGLSGQYSFFDQCPLGSGAGYGVPLALDRELCARLLGFSRVQNNVTYGGLCRGKFESRLIDAADQIAITLSKLAADLILFSLPEFAWFELPKELCTGSSIMPQKRNPDVLEIMRARAANIGGWSSQVKSIIRSLPSGYNRDYQETKAPVINTVDSITAMLGVTNLIIKSLKINQQNLCESFDKDIFATDTAIDLVSKGMTFRDAYHQVGTGKTQPIATDPKAALKTRTSTGTSGNPRLDIAQNALKKLRNNSAGQQTAVEKALTSLAGQPVDILARYKS